MSSDPEEVVRWIRDAKSTYNVREKLRLLSHVSDVIRRKPDTHLTLFFDAILDFHNESEEDVRKWVVVFAEEHCKHLLQHFRSNAPASQELASSRDWAICRAVNFFLLLLQSERSSAIIKRILLSCINLWRPLMLYLAASTVPSDSVTKVALAAPKSRLTECSYGLI